MNNHITFSQVCRMLDAQKMAYEVLALGNDWKAIITQYSGRLLGPFKGENGESVLWAVSYTHLNAYRYFFAGDRAKREKFAALPVETSHFPSPGDAVAGTLLWDRGHIGCKAGI